MRANAKNGLTKKHRLIYDSVVRIGKATIYKVHRDTLVNPSTVSDYLKLFVHCGLLETSPIKGKSRRCYMTTDMTYEEFEQSFEPPTAIPDPLLEQSITFELTDCQWNYIKANPTLSRSYLVEKLGVPRTVLLAAIDRRKQREGIKG